MDLYEGSKYYCTVDGVKDTINKFGVAIVLNVIDEAECQNTINGMWDYLEHITKNSLCKIKRDDVDTWRNYNKLYFKHSMLMQHWNVGQAQYIWNLRQNEKFVKIFAKIHNVNKSELLVSFDGSSVHFPSEITKIGWNRKVEYHCDQSFLRNDFECVQGWVNAFDTNEGDATLSFLERSHLFHKDFKVDMKVSGEKGDGKEDWYILGTNNDRKVKYYLEKGCTEQKIKCPKGSLVLWDSRTIHCGTEPLKERVKQNFRCVVYLCYLPRSLCNNANLRKKQKAFNDLRTTNHNPCKIKLFSKEPRTYGGIMPNITQINPPVLSDLGMKLAGF